MADREKMWCWCVPDYCVHAHFYSLLRWEKNKTFWRRNEGESPEEVVSEV